jgi:acyl dehydratase
MNLENVLAKQFDHVEQNLGPRDCILYALGIGIGDRPEDRRDLQFVYEQGLKVFPSQVNVIAHPGGWIRASDLGIDWIRVLHGEQSFAMHAVLEPGKTYVGSYRVTNVVDKGPGRGALLFLRKELREKSSQALVSTVTSTLFLRGDGGCGGTATEVPMPQIIPDREPDLSCSLAILPRAALIYRLSGDYNPIHADPAVARQAGFERPILHGLCSLGVATRAIVSTCCDDQPERLRSMQLRFTAPVYPGECLVTEIWRDGDRVSFRARVAERNVVVLNNGHAVVTLQASGPADPIP